MELGLALNGGGDLVLSVADEGRGYDPAATPLHRTGGFGLTSIREQARLLGGQLEIESAPGSGTRVVLRFPAGGD